VRTWLRLVVVLALPAGVAGAGEIVFRSGERLAGDLTDQVLLLSTGAEVVEVAPAEVAVLTPAEVRLRDGRVLRGTLVGGRVRARTGYGELAVRTEDLAEFRVAPEPAPAAVAPPSPTPAPSAAPPAAPAPPSARGPGQVADGGQRIGQGAGEVAGGVGRTVSEGADRLHDGFKALGLAIWEGMKSFGRAVEQAFTAD